MDTIKRDPLTKQEVTLEAVTCSAEALTELLTGAALHAHTKDDLIALNAVKLRSEDFNLVAEATDRFRLVSGSIKIHLIQDESGYLSDTLLSLSDIKRVIQFCKSLLKRQQVTITRSGDMVSISCGGDSITLSVLEAKFPPIAQFLEPIKEPAALTSLFFNPKYFGDLSKLAGKSGGVKVTFGVADNKPYQFAIAGESVNWRGCIMPMRERN